MKPQQINSPDPKPGVGSPLVSVITPTYNRAALLPRAISSVLSQDFTDLELIVIDDGSTDGTQQVLAGIKDSRVSCIRFDQNRGIGAARHQAVSRARGDFIAFVDSDDVWLPGKLRFQVEVLQRHPTIDVLFGDYRNINHVEHVDKQGFEQTAEGLARVQVRHLESEVLEITAGLPEALLTANFIGTCSVVVLRRSLVERVGNFNPRLSVEDIELWWRASLKGATFAYTTRSLIERHKDEGSISAKFSSYAPRYLEALDCFDKSATDAQRPELLRNIDLGRHRVWCGLTRHHALRGERGAALRSFKQSLRYKWSPLAFGYAIAGLLGLKTTEGARNLKRKLRTGCS
jgi:glycosyltransferase involved in cell wall biosynthesis